MVFSRLDCGDNIKPKRKLVTAIAKKIEKLISPVCSFNFVTKLDN
jgi:hypothetical protein